MLYLIVFVVWLVLSFVHREVIMQHQHYVSMVLGLFFVEMFSTYAFYRDYNITGIPSKVLLIVVAVLAAVRGTASLFLLLIVSMGYGVVIPSLGEKANRIYVLTGFHLLFTIVSIIIALTVRRSSGIGILLATLPVSVTFSIFVSWILSSMSQTKQSLQLRKQNVKLRMYERLTLALLILFGVSAVCMLVSVVVIVGRTSTVNWYATHWNSLWFFTDGWQVILAFISTMSLAYIFRPRALNRSYDINEISINPDEDEEDPIVMGKMKKSNLDPEASLGYYNNQHASSATEKGDLPKGATENLGAFSDDEGEVGRP